MTFCGGSIAVGGFETGGNGRGVDIWGRDEVSLLLLRDLLSDFMVQKQAVDTGGGLSTRRTLSRFPYRG